MFGLKREEEREGEREKGKEGQRECDSELRGWKRKNTRRFTGKKGETF